MIKRILHAAIWYPQRIYVGPYHGACFVAARQDAVQGFITNEGRLVGRAEALDIAEAAGQIVEKHRPYDVLLSEDLKPT